MKNSYLCNVNRDKDKVDYKSSYVNSYNISSEIYLLMVIFIVLSF